MKGPIFQKYNVSSFLKSLFFLQSTNFSLYINRQLKNETAKNYIKLL